MTHHRPERIAELIQEELARLLREEIRDPRIGFVTVTGVKVSPDLKHARVFVSVLEEDHERPLRALAGAAPFLRRALARRAGLRYTPDLRFAYDEAAEAGQRVESILAELREPAEDDGETDG